MTDDLAILEDYIQRCSNWGRWGSDDQLGTVNLITSEKVREAAVTVGVCWNRPSQQALSHHSHR
jgi:hypothetical protein